MAKKENEKVKEASEVLERMSMSYEERWLYDQRMLRKMDEMSLKEHAIKQEKLEIAKKLLEQKVDIDIIVKATELTKEEIVEISKNYEILDDHKK